VPSTRIEPPDGWIAGRHADVIDAVQRALVEGIRIPPEDRNIRILEYPPAAFPPMPGRGPKFTMVEITMLAGRSIEAKRRLYAALVRELGAFGLGPDEVKMVIHDEPRENWGSNGHLLSDVELRFKVEV
jgi:phenylpyruvate tautomerase PptA (4-oxalocrotonate tautomerase family)